MSRIFANSINSFALSGGWRFIDEPLTLACWVMMRSAKNATFLYLGSPKHVGYWLLGSDSTVLNCGKENDAGSQFPSASTSASYVLNKWHLVCGVFDSDTSRTAYIDGIAGPTNTTACTDPTPIEIVLGKIRWSAGDTNTMDGRLAHAAVWRRALNATEIMRLYKSRQPPNIIEPSGLAFYDPLDGGMAFGGVMTPVNLGLSDNNPFLFSRKRALLAKSAAAAPSTFQAAWASRSHVVGAGVY